MFFLKMTQIQGWSKEQRKSLHSQNNNPVPIQPGDVPATNADVEALTAAVDFQPATTIETGISRFVEWFLQYHEEKPIALDQADAA